MTADATPVATTVAGIRFAPVDPDELTFEEAVLVEDFGRCDPVTLVQDFAAGRPTVRQVGAYLLIAARRVDPTVGQDQLARLTYVQAYTAAADVLIAANAARAGADAAQTAATRQHLRAIAGVDGPAITPGNVDEGAARLSANPELLARIEQLAAELTRTDDPPDTAVPAHV